LTCSYNATKRGIYNSVSIQQQLDVLDTSVKFATREDILPTDAILTRSIYLMKNRRGRNHHSNYDSL
ncbi:hypothetical protein CLOM_g22245, partial [Closterium sp. NIES-68]